MHFKICISLHYVGVKWIIFFCEIRDCNKGTGWKYKENKFYKLSLHKWETPVLKMISNRMWSSTSQNESKVRLLPASTSIHYWKIITGYTNCHPQYQRAVFQKLDETEYNYAICFMYFQKQIRIWNISFEDLHI